MRRNFVFFQDEEARNNAFQEKGLKLLKLSWLSVFFLEFQGDGEWNVPHV